MIFVTLGTQDKSFKRLLEKIDELINKKIIKEEVIVQAGLTVYESKNMKILKLLSMEELDSYIEKCDLLITHAGVGSIMNALEKNKKVIAVPRRREYKEHTNNHQLQIAEEFSRMGYILKAEVSELEEKLKEAKTFKGKKYISNNAKFCQIIKDFIEQ